jgi:hypothetical protein
MEVFVSHRHARLTVHGRRILVGRVLAEPPPLPPRNSLARLDRPTGEPIHRYEHARPGGLVHVDMKKFGNIRRRRVGARSEEQSAIAIGRPPPTYAATGDRIGGMITADAAPIQSIASFRNGDMAGNFASGDSSGSICRWNPVTGEPIGAPIETGEPISSMATESLGNTPLLLAS